MGFLTFLLKVKITEAVSETISKDVSKGVVERERELLYNTAKKDQNELV